VKVPGLIAKARVECKGSYSGKCGTMKMAESKKKHLQKSYNTKTMVILFIV